MENKQKDNNLTELVFILDGSGSMQPLEADTIGGFNAMIDKQRREEGNAVVTTVIFNSTATRVHDRIPLEAVPRMTQREYTASGNTALLDAVGTTVEHIAGIHRYIRPEDVPARTLFVITTDGMENCSHTYSLPQVKALIEGQKAAGWEFLFIGANIDAVETAAGFGIGQERVARYKADARGTHLLYQTVGHVISQVSACRPMASDWSADLEADSRRE